MRVIVREGAEPVEFFLSRGVPEGELEGSGIYEYICGGQLVWSSRTSICEKPDAMILSVVVWREKDNRYDGGK